LYLLTKGKIMPLVKHVVRSPFNYDPDELSLSTGLSCPEDSLTDQMFKDEADINWMIDAYGKEVVYEQALARGGSDQFYRDITDMPDDLHTAKNQQRQGLDAFYQLPDNLQQRFQTPENYLNFFEDPRNRNEAIDLGLLNISAKNAEIVQKSPQENPEP